MKWILNSAIDTLPNKTNLKFWGKLVNDKCFCGQRQTLNHILNCCKICLDQGRYTARHDFILNYIGKCLDKEKFKCFIDIENHQTQAGGTISPNLVVTNLKPDIVVIDDKTKSVKIFELTVPAESRLEISHKLKMDKYSHLVTDIKSHNVEIIPFEIGAQQGHISRDNKFRLQTLHKYCSKNIKFKKFSENISAIALLSSYYIFNCRNTESWVTPDPILAPFTNQ